MQGSTRFNTVYLGLALLVLLLVQGTWNRLGSARSISYSEFVTLLRNKQVREVFISKERIRGTLITAEGGNDRFVTNRVEPELARLLDEQGVAYSQRVENSFLSNMLAWVLPLGLFLAIWFFLTRRMAGGAGGGLMAIGRSKAKVYVETDTKVTFADAAGVDEAKHELEEIVSFLKDPTSYGRLGARMPKGVLLVGPPGTGKTLLARAVAGEAGVPFFSISGSEFVEMFVGVGAARVRDLFEQAGEKAPCIIFIDELDAMGAARHVRSFAGGHDEKEQTLNQLLVELDGFDVRSGIVILAATNRPEILDPALLRAGRFDRQILVDRPDRQGRVAILNVHLRKISLARDVDADNVAALTPGFTGADLANLVNEAALVATRRGGDNVSIDDFTQAIERIVAGLEKKNRLLNPTERKIVAYHEMGHALVALACPLCDPVYKVSIIPRGIAALGYTIQRPTEERYLMTADELVQKMAVILGGRAAEHIVFGHLSTGAADDLSKATGIARSMVTRYGMVEKLGHVTYDSEPSTFLGVAAPTVMTRTYSDDTAHEIDKAVRDLVQHAFESARTLLARNRSVLEKAAAELLEKETLDEGELKALFSTVERGNESDDLHGNVGGD